MAKLDTDDHSFLAELTRAYSEVPRPNARAALCEAIHDRLCTIFDSDELYARSRLTIQGHTLTFTLLVSIDEDDETDYDASDVEYIVNTKSGTYTNG